LKTRAEIIDLLWNIDEKVLYLSKTQYVDSLDGWRIAPHYEGGVMVGATITKGSEFHFATFGGQWKMTRADIRRYLRPLIDRYGYVTTKTPKEDTRQGRFNKILGFFVTGEDEFFTHYKLERLRHA
jgi:hypothetical protein